MVNLRPSTLSLVLVPLVAFLVFGTTTAAFATPAAVAPPCGCSDVFALPTSPVAPNKFIAEVSNTASNIQLVQLHKNPADANKPLEVEQAAITSAAFGTDKVLVTNSAALVASCNGGVDTCVGFRLKATVANCPSAGQSTDVQSDFTTADADVTDGMFAMETGTAAEALQEVRVTSGNPGRVNQWDTSKLVTLTPPSDFFGPLANYQRVMVSIDGVPVNPGLGVSISSSTVSMMVVASCDQTVTAAVTNSCGQVVEVQPLTDHTVSFTLHGLGATSDPAPTEVSGVKLVACPPAPTASTSCSVAPGRAGATAGAAVLLLGLAAIFARRRRSR
jgi:MYXO-CTERM domain-containing protein